MEQTDAPVPGEINTTPTPEGTVGESVTVDPASPPKTAEQLWAELMNEMYKTVNGVVTFLASTPKYGWITSPHDVIFVASEFKIPEMIKPEIVGVMVVMGAEMVTQIRAILDGQKEGIKPVVIQ